MNRRDFDFGSIALAVLLALAYGLGVLEAVPAQRMKTFLLSLALVSSTTLCGGVMGRWLVRSPEGSSHSPARKIPAWGRAAIALAPVAGFALVAKVTPSSLLYLGVGGVLGTILGAYIPVSRYSRSIKSPETS
jgi:hypothetical protein